jgi:predicted PurR-regulated permease PerM
MVKPIPNIQIRQLLLLLLIGTLFLLLYWNLLAFLPALLGAYTFYVLMRHPMFFLTERWHWNRRLASVVLMLISVVLILLPLNMIVDIMNTRVLPALQNSQAMITTLETMIHEQEQRFGVVLLTPENIKALTDWSVQSAGNIVNATLNGVLTLLMLYVILYFMLNDGKRMEAEFFKSLPLKPENILYVRSQLHSLVFSNAIGIPLMGVVQGFAGFLAYYFSGVEDVWLWTTVTFVSGMLPIFGTMLAYIPLSIILYSNGMHGQAIFILMYGFLVIGSVDNVARMWLLKKIGDTHPLVTLFGVIVGLKLFGFVGFVFGPIMISVLLMLIGLYNKEFGIQPEPALTPEGNAEITPPE